MTAGPRCGSQAGRQAGFRPRFRVRIVAMTAVIAGGLANPALAAPDPYGGVSVGGVYSSDAARTVDEELDGSAIVGRAYAGVQFDPAGDTTQIEVSSGYYGYTTREDRWTNRLAVDQLVRLGDGVQLGIEAAGSTDIITLERRGTDQASLAGQLQVERSDHRAALETGLRRRWYEDGAKSWAPYVEASYRYRIGSWHNVVATVRKEWTEADRDTLDYERLIAGAYYTRPLARRTRVRAGLVHRRWTWDQRFAPGGDTRRERLWIPQARLMHGLSRDDSIDLDYRRVLRRSNDDRFDRDGNRLTLTFRHAF
ncbi:hypothetical protein [Altericroceibacterium xinjiangense]|uniref:hypothetical protein n=1 Tax=Altericroceibacterium xinjiangense TaxID=762261 RepID=UPI000F7FA723|nr:hypothetical protein [Altericroceibacterium xinjiangense]